MSKLRLRWVLLAVFVQLALLVLLVTSWYPDDPSLQDLDRLGDRYEIVDTGEIQCGSGGTHQCDWEITVEHSESESELREAFALEGLDVGRVESGSRGQSSVLLTWIVSDPGQSSVLGALALAFGVATGLLVSMGLVVRRVRRPRKS